MEPCPFCHGFAWTALPNPSDDRSVLSDLRVIDIPLDKAACIGCALVRRNSAAIGNSDLFARGYSLYDHPPGAPRETLRQTAYAQWIIEQVGIPPKSVLDIGCGNGSLLLALGKFWSGAELRGVDPSPESVSRAVAAGIRADVATFDHPSVDPADLVVSVNVIEHSPDPIRFVRSLSMRLRPDGTLVIICPDGTRPWDELVFADHLWSLTASHLKVAMEAADLSITGISYADPRLGDFVMVQARRHSVPSVTLPVSAPQPSATARAEYLNSWRKLDEILVQRSGSGPIDCFGIGETAGLLRAYAPHAWSRVTRCLADDPEQNSFGDLPVFDYKDSSGEAPVLLGVRPMLHDAFGSRFERDGRRIVRWDDVITD